MTSLIDEVESLWGVTETAVMAFSAKVTAGFQVLEADVKSALAWLEAHSGDIAAGAETLTAVVSTLAGAGIGIPAIAVTSIDEANVAVTALSAAVKAAGGATTLQATATAVAAGYSAAKTAQAAVASAGNAIVSQAQMTPAAAPIPAP